MRPLETLRKQALEVEFERAREKGGAPFFETSHKLVVDIESTLVHP